MQNDRRCPPLPVLCALLLAALALPRQLPAAQPAARGASPPVRRGAASAPRWQIRTCRQYVLTVADLDRALAFYHGLLGLPLLEPPQVRSRGDIQRLASTPGAALREASLRLPDTDVSLVLRQFTRIGRRPQRPHQTDPGAATLVIRVSDPERIAQAAGHQGVKVLTRAPGPVQKSPAVGAIVLVDPNGVYVRLEQPLGAPGQPVRNQGAYLVFTIAEPGPLQRFYHDLLGLHVDSSGFMAQGPLEVPMGASRTRVNHIEVLAGMRPILHFVAFRGMARRTYLSRAQDPGASAATLTVTDLSAALRTLHAAGAVIITAGGQPVALADGARAIMLRDPAGVLLELIQEP